MNNLDKKTAIQSVQVRQMIAASNTSLATSVLLAAILAYMQLDVIDFAVVLGWFSLIVLVMFTRLALVMAYQRSPVDDGTATHAWMVRFRLGVMASAMVWGSAGFLLFPANHPQQQMFLIFVLAGLTAGGVVSYSADLVSGIVFSISVLVPPVIRLLVAGDSLSMAMAMALMLYLGFMLMSLRHISRNMRENIALRLEADAREKIVRAGEERYRLLLSHLPVGIFHYDANLIVTYCNDCLAGMLHSSVERIIGLDMKLLKDQSILPSLRKTLGGESAYYEGHYNATFSDASGWAAMTCAPSRDDGGEVTGGIAIVQDITERKRMELQLSRRLRHRDVVERITRISLDSTSIEELLGKVLGEMQTVFNADRAWFLYPCDPDAPSWSVPMERTRPEWPGAFARGMVMPMTPEVAEVFREVLASAGPLPYGPAAARHIPAAVAGQFSIRSQIQMALRPRVGSPWAMGLHHCAQACAYDEDDLLLFNDIGRRVADALSSMLIMKNLRESEKKFRTLFEEMVSGFALHEMVFDKDGKPVDYITLEVNREFERLLNTARENVIGKKAYETFPELDRKWLSIFGKVALTKEPYSYEEYASNVGKWFAGTAFCPEEGKVAGTFIDITERKMAEDELKRSNTELEQFSYAISHDMRQPLRMISSYLQLLEMGLAGQLDGEKRSYFNFAIEGAKRIDQMLMDLLEYSRVGRKGEPLDWVESRAVLDETLQFLQPVIAEAQAKLNITGEWPRILASHDEILMLLQNLIGNATKYRIAGRIPEITVISEVVGNEWHLSVADNGVGIIPEQIKRLFQMFQRLHTRAVYEGTGIGLALCRKIAEHHKGRIWAESAGEGQGSKFCVVLPVLQKTSSSIRQKES